jgi:hypothetical protein
MVVASNGGTDPALGLESEFRDGREQVGEQRVDLLAA